MTETEMQAKVAEVGAISDAICDLVADKPHAVTLDALMSVYRALAKKFDCCTQSAASCCFAASIELAKHAEIQRAMQPKHALPPAGGLH